MLRRSCVTPSNVLSTVLCRTALVLCALAAPALACAQTAAPRAPATQPDSATAQEDVFGARQAVLDRRTAENNYRYQVAQHECYSHFLLNHCLNEARDAMRATKAEIRIEQLKLNEEERAL